MVISLDPGMAFGTGTHATTSMCIQRLEELVNPDCTVFDDGTSGKDFHMTAALGCRKLWEAVDIDAGAVSGQEKLP